MAAAEPCDTLEAASWQGRCSEQLLATQGCCGVPNIREEQLVCMPSLHGTGLINRGSCNVLTNLWIF